MLNTLDNLLVAISGALEITGSHFLSKNVFGENVVGYVRYSKCWGFQTLAIVFSTFENLLVDISGAQEMKEGHFLP